MQRRETASRAEIALRVEYWRKRRGMTRQVFADRMGRSVSWVDMIRRGDRQLDRLSVLDQIAEILEVSVYALIDGQHAAQAAECVDSAEVRSIKQALQRYDGITKVFRSSGSRDEPNLSRLHKQVNYAWSAFQASHYSTLGPLVGDLIIGAQYAAAEAADDDRHRAWELLTQVYQIATSTLRKLGRHHLEWLAAERAVSAAEQTSNAVLIGGAAFRLVNTLGASDGAEAAMDAAEASAHRLQSRLDVDELEPAAVYGTIFLQGAIAAGVNDDRRHMIGFLAEADRLAVRVGPGRNDYWTAFGPANVDIYRVSAYVAMHYWSAALAATDQMNGHQAEPAPTRAAGQSLG